MRDTTRSNTLFDKHEFRLPVTIFGAGGVGGYIAQGLINLGVGNKKPITVYDGDVVEKHNLANQVYGDFGTIFVGKKKVDALAECVALWEDSPTGTKTLIPLSYYVEDQVPVSGIAFVAVDSMKSRLHICEKSLWRNRDVVAVIETRMNARYCAVNILDPNNDHHIDCWSKICYSDAEADNEPGCGGHDVVGTTSMATAAIAVSAFIKIAAYLKNPIASNLVPNQFELDLNTFKSWTRIWEEE